MDEMVEPISSNTYSDHWLQFPRGAELYHGTPPLAIEAQPATVTQPGAGNKNADHAKNLDGKENNLEQEMIDTTNAVKTAAIRGRAVICRLIHDAILKGTIEPIQKIHLQCKENKETKQLKLPLISHASTKLPRV
jgi:hypothetical protein